MVGELSLFFRLSPKTVKEMKEMILFSRIVIEFAHNEEEASIYKQKVMWQGIMDSMGSN